MVYIESRMLGSQNPFQPFSSNWVLLSKVENKLFARGGSMLQGLGV